MLQRVRLVATLLGFLAMFVPPAAAQVTTGTIVGTVHDLNGIVPGATVTIREVNQGTANSYVTDETGSYTAPFLTPGTYAVEVNVQGFRRWRREGVILQVNQRARVDVTLEVGGIEETTTVTAEAPLLRTDSSEVGTVIEERAIKELPLNGRNFATLVYLTPGITPGQADENLSGASTFNPRGASNFNALGHQANANAWLIDGIDNNEYTFNTVIIAPSVEQVREFKVLSGVFSAEFGRGAGVVSVATKSGSNLLHGTVFEYLRDDAFDARNFFVRKVSQADGSLVKDPKPPLESPPVRRRGRRSAGASRAVRRPQPHVLLRRLRGTEREARAGVRQHGADGADAHRQLQRLPRRQRQPDHHLRSADHAPQSRRSTRPGRSAPRTRSSCAIPIPTTSSRPSA